MPPEPTPGTPGFLWPVLGPYRFAISLGAGFWSVLRRRPCGEYTLDQVKGLEAVGQPRIPVATGWEPSFNVLAAAHGVNTTWAREHAKYQEAGFARAAGSRTQDSTHVLGYEHREALRRSVST